MELPICKLFENFLLPASHILKLLFSFEGEAAHFEEYN